MHKSPHSDEGAVTETLKGCVERITFYNPDSGFAVVKLACPHHRDLVCAVGRFSSIQPGESVQCVGRWHHHPQHGLQFLVESSQIQAPADVLGIRKYLQSGLVKGIGPVYAEKIVQQFGEATLEIIDREPHRLLEISGIGPTRLAKIQSCWAQQRSIREVMVFLQSFGVSPAFAQRVYRAYRDASIPKVREDPYCLARDVKGIGFKTADQLAQKMGISVTAPRRLEAGIEYVLAELAQEGHVCYPREALAQVAADILEVDLELTQQALIRLLQERRLVASLIDGHPYIWKKALWLTERGVAHETLRIASTPTDLRSVDLSRALEWVQEELKLRLAPKQREAVSAALTQKMLLITGGPGTGKSTITRAILAILQRLTRRILLAAPTGRAAKRMTEITGRHAQTLHSLLEWDFGANTFKRSRDYPLPCQLLIVDEASMIDTVLAYSLLRAIPSNARLILVGDVNQLPSVGPGNVLKDLIASKALPVVELTDIFRQSAGSHIVVNAHRIHAGEFPYLKSSPRSDFFFVERTEPAEIRDTIVELVTTRLPRKYRLHALDDIQILAPMKRGVIGTGQLNLALQNALNPNGTALIQHGQEFREGDKVMQSRNNYDKKVFNGDVGRIGRIDRINHEVEVVFDGRRVIYEFLELDELQLAYAVSIHKFQGSECPCAVIPVHTSHFTLLNRNLLYTGVTRGRRLVVLVGTKKAIAIAVNNNDVQKRHTGLTAALSEIGQKPPSACCDGHRSSWQDWSEKSGAVTPMSDIPD